MRIAILTQPLLRNYGGILQNYALQQILIKLGHSPITFDRHRNPPESAIKSMVKKVYRNLRKEFNESMLTRKERINVAEAQQTFIKKHITTSVQLNSQDSFNAYAKTNPADAYIVGSDQCWRPCYSSNISDYYLGFVENESAKRIAYAVSFGTDNWESPASETETLKKLAKKFDAISVREKSAISLVKDYLNLPASWVLDPTMVLGRDGFEPFIIPSDSTPFITTYLLEEDEKNKVILNSIAEATGIKRVVNNISKNRFYRFQNIAAQKDISIEQWISNIANSSFLLTDSFHGAVFAILFNVPFAVKLNKVRGNSRLESLLEDFGLTHCMISSPADPIPTEFDWTQINQHLSSRQKDSIDFLKSNLNA